MAFCDGVAKSTAGDLNHLRDFRVIQAAGLLGKTRANGIHLASEARWSKFVAKVGCDCV